MNKKLLSVFLSGSIMTSGFCLPVVANEFKSFEEVETTTSSIEMYRLYNRGSGEHFYTADTNEKDTLVNQSWKYEGIGWYAPSSSSTPVYRLYNQNSKDHHYTIDQNERDTLIKTGWKDEGIGWYSDDSKTIPLYRQYNPNAKSGNHNYTTNKDENDQLCRMGWKAEGIGWYAMKEGEPAPVEPDPTPVDYTAAYRPILDEIKKVIIDSCQHGGPHGISENPFFLGLLSDYGYIIQDFSGDGIPELIVGMINNSKGGVSDIIALYTLIDNKPINVFYGESRLRGYYGGGSQFIYADSCAAFYRSIGSFTLSKDGRNLNFSEYYYVEQVSAYPYDVKDTYSSTGPDDTGEYVGKEEVFKRNRERIISKAQNLNLTPLSSWK